MLPNPYIKVVGIETSCDDTSVAIVANDKSILHQQIFTQEDHSMYGGVVPELASRNHSLQLPRLLDAMDQALDDADIVAIAGTTGPGLLSSVIVGSMTARALAYALQKPFIAIDHLHAHCLSARLCDRVELPYIVLLISGGHCQLGIMNDINSFTVLGTTLDDSAGECFDKAARTLGLGYPGGKYIEQYANNYNGRKVHQFTRPLSHGKQAEKFGYSFSFSGLKAQFIRAFTNPSTQDDANIGYWAKSIQMAIADHLLHNCRKVLAEYGAQIPRLAVVGGVAANQYIKSRFEVLCQEYNISLHIPPAELCTDNGAMIAWAGVENIMQSKHSNLDTKCYANSISQH